MPDHRNRIPDKTIVLIGMMGCGKSTVGRRLAKYLGMPFADLDNVISATEGMSITKIFEEHGEEYFRQKEHDHIEKILDGKPSVLATGGGSFINESIRGLIKNKGISVWIHADFETLLERVSRKNTRPLLEAGNKAEILEDLIEKRYPVYEEADFKVETGNGNHNIVMHKIIEAINGRT